MQSDSQSHGSLRGIRAVRSIQVSDLPNIISALRIAAVIPIVYLLVHEAFGWALLLFAVSGASDGLDGWLARHHGWRSPLGGILDPVADKALLISSVLVLGATGHLPLWLALVVFARDLVILVGGILYQVLIEDIMPSPLPISKLNTLVQIVLVLVVVADAGPLPLPAALVDGLIWTCLATTLASGASYVIIWGGMARRRGLRDDR
jgi:cardiolipin synthase